MGKNLLRDWESGEEIDEVNFEKFTGTKNKELSDSTLLKNDHSQERKEKEKRQWEDLEDV